MHFSVMSSTILKQTEKNRLSNYLEGNVSVNAEH